MAVEVVSKVENEQSYSFPGWEGSGGGSGGVQSRKRAVILISWMGRGAQGPKKDPGGGREVYTTDDAKSSPKHA